MRTLSIFVLGIFLAGCAFEEDDLGQAPAYKRFAKPKGSAEWSGAIEAPVDLKNWYDAADAKEPGERLVIKGRIFKPDGKTPAGGALLYFYHTNAKGIYPKRGNESGNGRQHGYLRGWILTDADGNYEIRSIRAMPYPSGGNPAHIHATLTANGHPEHWIEDFWFEGDPDVPSQAAERYRGTGRFHPVVKLTKDRNGVWQGERDLKLELPGPDNGGLVRQRPPE